MSTKNNESFSLDQAEKVIIEPYITEKTFNLIEKENKLTFVVAEKSTKKQIAEALLVLYESKAAEVNTLRTIQGKKAVVKFIAAEGARDLATKLGLV
ncbi:MAG TPA: 50S ribosomal protein L23 [Nitrososphaeraceae archaeon]|nr:50S ribosomal protein L23 [Nitrososphaeraceae archaeon]